MKRALLVVLALSSCAAAADQVTTADAILYPQVFQDDQGYKACGVRVVFYAPSPQIVRGGEFSLILATRPNLGGMLKAGGMTCPAPCNDPKTLKNIHGKDYRISRVKTGVPLKLLNTFPAESPTFTMGVADPVETTDLLMAIVSGERIQFAYSPDDLPAREAYTFTAQRMTDEEMASFDACFKGALGSAREGVRNQ